MQLKTLKTKIAALNGDTAAIKKFVASLTYTPTRDRAIQAMEELGLEPAFVMETCMYVKRAGGLRRQETFDLMRQKIQAEFDALGPVKTNSWGQKDWGHGIRCEPWEWLWASPVSPAMTVAFIDAIKDLFSYGGDARLTQVHNRLKMAGVSGVKVDAEEMANHAELADITGTSFTVEGVTPTAAEFVADAARAGIPGQAMAVTADKYNLLHDVCKILVRSNKKGAPTKQHLDFFLHIEHSYCFALAWPKAFWDYAMANCRKPPAATQAQFVVEYWEKREMPYEFWVWMSKSVDRMARTTVYGILESMGVQITIGPKPVEA